MMISDEGHERWIRRARTWQDRLADLGLESLIDALANVARPLAPLAAQVLWVAQPALGALHGGLSQEAGDLAELLHDPAALDRLMAQLLTDPSETG